jgi:hypothetical protein
MGVDSELWGSVKVFGFTFACISGVQVLLRVWRNGGTANANHWRAPATSLRYSVGSEFG